MTRSTVPMLETTRTYRANIVNHSQVSDDLDDFGHSASKLWNVARYYSQQVWDDTGETPSEADLKREVKDYEEAKLSVFVVVRDGLLFPRDSGTRVPVATFERI